MYKILIVFYSLFGNAGNLALEIAAQTGGTLRELIPDKNYSFDYNTAAKEVRYQITRGFCPKLISGNEPIHDYQTVFISSPNSNRQLKSNILHVYIQPDHTTSSCSKNI
jgi:flavodoxin